VIDQLANARVYDLEQPRHAGAPVFPAHEPGVILNLHRRHERDAPEARTSASAMLVMTEHSGTHIDALCHQAYDGRMHGGVEITSRVQTSTGFTALGIDTVAPIVCRGVLLDVGDDSPQGARVAGRARPGGSPSRRTGGQIVGPTELERAAAGIDLRPGDAVLVRLGSGALWADRPAYMAAGGVSADGSRWLAARRPRLVGADNIAWDLPDAHDPQLGTLPGHTILIVEHGIHIVESLFLEELAADGVREFGFVCLPLKLRGGTGSPVRPIALV
jgi:kynurenine formamidase